MKPENWEKLSKEEKLKIGLLLFNSFRGKYIISQALFKAIKVMKRVPKKFREESNIQDMEILYETLFPFYNEIMEMKPKQFEKLLKKEKVKKG